MPASRAMRPGLVCLALVALSHFVACGKIKTDGENLSASLSYFLARYGSGPSLADFEGEIQRRIAQIRLPSTAGAVRATAGGSSSGRIAYRDIDLAPVCALAREYGLSPDGCWVDIYVPAGAPVTRLLLGFHGGGWVGGGHQHWRRQYGPGASMDWTTVPVQNGHVVMNFDYGGATPDVWGATFRSLLCHYFAVHFFSRLPGYQGVTPTRVFGIGNSAGGHLVAFLAAGGLFDAVVSLGGVYNLGTFFHQNPQFQSLLASQAGGPPAGNSRYWYEALSPLFAKRETLDTSVIHAVHGTADTVVPFAQCQEMAAGDPTRRTTCFLLNDDHGMTANFARIIQIEFGPARYLESSLGN